MKLIEGLKEIKRLNEKLDDLLDKVSKNCAHSSIEKPEYGDKQRQKIDEWMQSYHDTVKRILALRTAIQTTNLATEVTIELGGKQVTKTIAEWIHRRRDLAHQDFRLYTVLNSKGVKTGRMPATHKDGEPIEVTAVTYYDPVYRDAMREHYHNEPSLIDAKLEIVNAVTDVLGME